MEIKINKRNLSESVREEEQALVHYNKLKEKLNINFQKEIYCKIEAMKVFKKKLKIKNIINLTIIPVLMILQKTIDLPELKLTSILKLQQQ